MEILQRGYNFENKAIENTHNLISCLLSDFKHFTMAGRLNRITDYIYENYKRKLTLQEIAEREHLSMFYLSHAIKASAGMSFQELLNFIRVKESEILLLGTNKKISVISDECGFSALRYYIKHFQTWFGLHPSEYREKYADKVIRREVSAKYESFNAYEIEEIIKKQAKGVYNEYISENKQKPNVYNIDIIECMSEKQKYQFPEDIFEKETMRVAARPFNLFKKLNERILFSSKLCVVSTSASKPSDIGNLSILIYNYDEEFCKGPMGRENFLEFLKAYDKEAEILLRCKGISGRFRVTRYKMTKQNVISACEEWTRGRPGPVNKRQALLNSWSTLPNIEANEITAGDTLNLTFTLRGLSAELILIDRY